MNRKNMYIGVALFAGGIIWASTSAATVIENNVQVKASTGGNNVQNAQEGKTEASVFIETIVDGEVVQRVDETKQGQAGESIEIEKRVEYTSEDSETQIEANASVQHNQEEVEEEQEEEIITNTKQPVVSKVIEFFRNLFSWFFA